MASKIFNFTCLHRLKFLKLDKTLRFKTFRKTLNAKNHGVIRRNVFVILTAIGFLLNVHKVSHIIPAVKAAEGESLRKKFNFIADVVSKAANAVVAIEVRGSGFFSVMPSNGSGFIVEDNGLVLTNAHVVMNKVNNNVSVKLIDGRTYTGTVEDIDIVSDLATIRIQAKNLPVLRLGSSFDLRPGEWVVAIGSPLTLSNTITAGVISTPKRFSQELGMRNKEMSYIQTDASITFGNSGGPLVNLDGEAIGINCMKITGGISFAIPIDYAKEFLLKSQQKKGITKLYLERAAYTGLFLVTLPPDVLREMWNGDYKVPTSAAFVGQVIAGSPGDSGGLKPGDIVTHVNSDAVEGATDVYNALETGKPLQLRVLREGIFLNLTLTPEQS